ncbi:hypothetical protein Pcinc_015949 [Petrolisthes cinctipes]|uniref:CCHC-type domain-containing protein n=1 Tax=Petrolisthes cinctipes TaxID=88211 RepID=A0AAE1FTE6_PETCI|nr:hypothetical protein Pcinc_015949 [Petrolisthes cinctipes]
MPVLISQDDVESFLRSNPSFEEIDVLTKHELQLVARGLGILEVSDILKANLVEKVCNEMQVRSGRSVQSAQGCDMAAGAEDDVEEQREVEPVTIGQVSDVGLPSMREILNSSVTDQQVELARIQAQVEMARINAQLEQQRLECGNRRESDVLSTDFDVTKHMKMVPEYIENDPTEYFMSFEKVAFNMRWPKDKWAILLQGVLKGKAISAYTALEVNECNDYEKVKAAILHAYELVPEAYRLRFRNNFKSTGVSHVDFLHEKDKAFKRWLHSKQVNGDYEKLYELLLLEDFCRTINRDIYHHILERGIENGARAAIIADEYVISRKMGNVSRENVKNKTYDYNNVPPPRRNVVYPPQGTTQHRSTGPLKQGEPTMGKQVRYKPKACFYCGKLGHLERECFKKSKEVKDSQSQYLRDFKAVSFISSLEDNYIDVKKHHETECSESKQGTFDNFILDGKLILGGKTVPIKLLRDTGASQSLILSKLVGDYENLGRNVLLRGLSGCVSAPLVEVTLTSNLVSGRVIVGSIEDLPVSGIDMILGNDLAGGRVHPVPIVSNEPERHKATEELVKRDPVVFLSCAVTRAMSQNALLAPEHVSVDDEESVESGKITDGEEDVINLGEIILGCSPERIASRNPVNGT